MGIFDKIKSFFEETTQTPPTPTKEIVDKSKLIKTYSDKGDVIYITRSEWCNKVLPEQLKKAWNDSEALYGSIVMAMQDGFFEEIIEATKHLIEIDKSIDRSYNALGIAYLNSNTLELAEQTLELGISKSENKGYLTTNLAKVYSAQGYEDKMMHTLWQSILLDPNQDNGLSWYTVIEFEKGGEPARLEAYKKVATLPNSWRAKLYIARHYLEQKEFETAKKLYQEILSIAINEPDAIWIMTGDLGINNCVDLIFELVFPIFNVNIHGINASLNMIQACIQTKRKEEGLCLVKNFKKLERYDYLQIINDFETRLNNM
jgi:tetratricopeptide (TPR) repeat protein